MHFFVIMMKVGDKHFLFHYNKSYLHNHMTLHVQGQMVRP